MKMNHGTFLKPAPTIKKFKENQKSASRSKRTMRKLWGTDQTIIGIRRYERNKRAFRYQWSD